MPETRTPSGAYVREINGARYAKSRGRLYQLGADVPAGRVVRGLGVLDTTAEGDRVPIIAELTSDDEGTMRRLVEALRLTPFDPHEPDPLRGEIERLEREGFVAVAAGARVANAYRDPEPIGPLDLGDVSIDARALTYVDCRGITASNCHLVPQVVPFSSDDVRGFLKRHANGDHGDFGKAGDVDLDDDMRWAPGVFGWPVRNAIAIEAGRGIVRSRFGKDVAPLAKQHPSWHPSWRMRPQIEVLDVATLIGRCTAVWPARSGVGF